MWEHFAKQGTNKAQCNHCKKELVYNGSTTSNLKAHLKCAHPTIVDVDEREEKPSLARIDSFTVSSFQKPCGAARADLISQLLVDWIVADMRPLTIVGDSGLKRLLALLEPGYSLPSRTYITKLIRQRHENCRKELMKRLEDATALALTTDAWTSKATMSFATHTVHYITSDWKLASHVLETSRFHGSHTADHIAKKVRDVVSRTGVNHQAVVSIVSDEAANMLAAGRQLKKEVDWDSLACAAHRLQTCIRHAMESSKSVTRTLARSRKLVGHFHHSALATEALFKSQVTLSTASGKPKQPVKVIQDVSTRWNSSFYMLRRLLQLKLPIMAVLEDANVTKPEHRLLMLKDKDWGLAQALVDVLSPLEKATTVLGGESYVTTSIVLPVATSLVRHLQQPARAGDSETITSFRRKLATELETKFGLDPIAPTTIEAVCAALDPRSRALTFLDEANGSTLKERIIELTMTEVLRVEPKELTPPSSESNTPAAKRFCDSASHDSPLDFFFECQAVQESLSNQIQAEVQAYFAEKPAPSTSLPLDWWRSNAERFPHLQHLARKFLCIPATSVPSERVFSAAGTIVSKLRSALSPENVDALIFLQTNRGLKGARASLPATLSHLPVPCPAWQKIDPEEVLADEMEPVPELPDLQRDD